MRLIDIDPINKDLTLKKRVLTAKYGEYAAEDGSYMSWREIFELVNRQPEVDAVPVKRGKWITKSNPNYSPFDPCSSEELHICNQCGYEQEFGTNYCPYCGSKMDGERKDDEAD